MAENDMTEKTLESYADVFADIVNVLLCDGVRVIDPADLRDALPRSSYKMDGQLRAQERDTAKYWLSGNIRLALIGLENQSEIDADMPLRIIGYDGAAYRDQLNHDEKGSVKMRFPVVTLVLYFGYERHWNKPKKLTDCFKIPPEIAPYVNDYKVNLFEIAWLPEETIAKFRSDFRFVADYFGQKRKNKHYQAPSGEVKHVREVMELLSAITQDTRFMDAYNARTAEGGVKNMEMWIDQAEARGEKRGEARGKISGKLEERLNSIRNLLKNTDFSLQKAMDVLEIPVDDQPKYAAQL